MKRRLPTMADRRQYRRVVYGRLIKEVVSTAFGSPGRIRVLDVGCGSGLVSRTFKRICSDATVIGVDMASVEIKKARSNACSAHLDIRYSLGDMASLPFGSESFDAVLAGLVFFEMEPKDRAACLCELYRVLKRGGRLLLIEGTGMQDFAGQMRKAGFKESARIETAANDIYDAVK